MKNYNRLHCRTLLKLAPTDTQAAIVLKERAGSWETCAVGEAAVRVKKSVKELKQDTQLFCLGSLFYSKVLFGNYSEATEIYNRIDNLTKDLK